MMEKKMQVMQDRISSLEGGHPQQPQHKVKQPCKEDFPDLGEPAREVIEEWRVIDRIQLVQCAVRAGEAAGEVKDQVKEISDRA